MFLFNFRTPASHGKFIDVFGGSTVNYVEVSTYMISILLSRHPT